MRLVCTHSEHVTVSWLLGSLVGDHFVLEANQNLLHGVLRSPLNKHGELGGLNSSSRLVHRWEVDAGVKLDNRSDHGVLRTALNLQEIDTVVKVCVRGSNKSGVPPGEGLVIALVKTVGNVLSAKALFTSLELFVESESTGNYNIQE